MTTADYALIVSLMSALVSIVALLWNVWQKYIFVKPSLQVTLGVYTVFHPTQRRSSMEPGQRLLTMIAWNMGPGPAILHSCVLKTKADRWKRGRYGVLNPIHGDPTSSAPVSVGPFSGGLPSKIDAGESKSFYFPYDADCFLKEPMHRVGMADTYGRNSWCRRRDLKTAAAAYRKDFGAGAAAGATSP